MMRRLLIVSPQFAPVNAPDMQRARMSLRHFASFGWQPTVLAVRPDRQEGVREEALLASVPADVSVVYTGALPVAMTRPFGIGSVALRAGAHLYRTGRRMIRRESIDLVFFSTTMFPAMALGRLWKARTGVPYVLDFQDPWVSDFLDTHPEARPPKYAWASRLHRVLEPFAMKQADGVVAVSPGYAQTLRHRYPRLTEAMCATVPFGFADEDFEVAAGLTWTNPWFARTGADGCRHGVYLGRGGADMETATRILFRAIGNYAQSDGTTSDLRFWCIGTDYAAAGRGKKTLEPIAEAEGAASIVTEEPERTPYFEGLRLLKDADFLVILGSTDAEYSPSKIYTYLAAGRPLVAIVHARSPVVPLLREAQAGPVMTFQGANDVDAVAASLQSRLPHFLASLNGRHVVPEQLLEPMRARELTRRQCALFDSVIRRRALGVGEPCPE